MLNQLTQRLRNRSWKLPLVFILVALIALTTWGWKQHQQEQAVLDELRRFPIFGEEDRAPDWIRLTGLASLFPDKHFSEIVAVSIDNDDQAKRVSQYCDLSYLEGVTLVGPEVTEEALSHLNHAQQITSLRLDSTSLKSAGLVSKTNYPNLKLLFLSGGHVDLQFFKGVSRYPALYCLRINSLNITDQEIEALCNATSLPVLHILNCPNITAQGLQKLSQLSKLEALHLVDLPLTDLELFPFAKLKKLRYLRLKWTGTTKLSAQTAKDLASLPLLESLEFAGTELPPEGIELLAQNKSLEALAIPQTRVEVSHLKKLFSLPNLAYLHLAGDHLSPECVNLINSRSPNFQLDITLNENIPSPDTVKSLAKLKSLTTLTLNEITFRNEHIDLLKQLPVRRLDLRKVTFQPGVFHKLKQLSTLEYLYCTDMQLRAENYELLPQFKQLKSLDLIDMKLSDEMIPVLSQMTFLHSMDLMDNSFTPAGKAKLVKALPNCSVNFILF